MFRNISEKMWRALWGGYIYLACGMVLGTCYIDLLYLIFYPPAFEEVPYDLSTPRVTASDTLEDRFIQTLVTFQLRWFPSQSPAYFFHKARGNTSYTYLHLWYSSYSGFISLPPVPSMHSVYETLMKCKL